MFNDTFIDDCLNDNAKLSDLDDYVDYWHDHDTGKTLREFLGMTEYEYAQWGISDDSIFQEIIRCRKNNVEFDTQMKLRQRSTCTGTFIVKKTNTGYKFDLLASNGEVIATSEVYTSEDACLKGVESVRKNAPIANIENRTEETVVTAINPKIEVYKDKAGEIRFRLKARNGEIIATSEGYKTKVGYQNGIDSFRKANSADISFAYSHTHRHT